MHVYIYDSFLNHKKYDNILARVETRLTDLGLNGKINRMGVMKNVKASVENELKRGAKTITAVGSDETLSQVASAIAGAGQIGQAVPLGIIPIGDKNNFIAESLGVPIEVPACDILSARRIEKIDLGRANNIYFIAGAKITNRGTSIEMDNSYTIEIMEDGEVDIVSLPIGEEALPAGAKFNPQDGMLELFIRTKTKKGFLKLGSAEIGQSIFSLKKLTIHNNKDLPVILDGSVEAATPVQISILKQKLNVIVGKRRRF